MSGRGQGGPAVSGWAKWAAPAGLDPEVLSLCMAMNAFPGITTTSSCCGHGREPFGIYFQPESLDDLPALLYWFDGCHTGQYGWRVRVFTDCAADHATFEVEGPAGGYESADVIAKCMLEATPALRGAQGGGRDG